MFHNYESPFTIDQKPEFGGHMSNIIQSAKETHILGADFSIIVVHYDEPTLAQHTTQLNQILQFFCFYEVSFILQTLKRKMHNKENI